MIVVDSNIVSEVMRPWPAPQLVAWIRSHSPEELVTTAVTVAEIRYGIARLPEGLRRTQLTALAEQAQQLFGEFVLPFDTAAARAYPQIVSSRDAEGRPISGFDAQIAAICVSRGFTLATRNVSDFESLGLTIIDPWSTT
ncbi:type II toxin-antitoxin system VapC family toxin [Paramicrobacterium fandaimingii]|uniref:type II toxin-antitoxin system VapC family toxin n=1 Tax=Paramicrobacterium fandaimingii TaxID=2708079 RepID=UPI001423556A|nr:type II toxin-antitoxin system VapC family toxin [Microbacterium fandaimingii]